MNKVVDGLLRTFHREHPFTQVPEEVFSLLEAAYEAGKTDGIIEDWTKEVM